MSFLSDFYHNFVEIPMINLVQIFENLTHDTGFAFVCVAIVANLIMFPIYKKMYIDGQKMRYITPKLMKIQEEFKTNPQMLLLKRGEILKKHEIKTGRNFLILLIQMPFLFAIFNVIRRISNGEQINEVYNFIHADGIGRFSGHLLGINVGTYPNSFSWGFLLPLSVGILMYIQGMYLYRWNTQTPIPVPELPKKDKKEGEIDFGEQLQKSMEIQMIYVLPFIYVFTNFLLPIGLNAYLIAGTLIGTLRQIYLKNYYNKHAEILMKDIIADDPEIQKELKKNGKIEKEKGEENIVEIEAKDVVVKEKKAKKKAKKK